MRDHVGKRAGCMQRAIRGLQLGVGCLSQQRAGEQRIASGLLAQALYAAGRQPAASKRATQRAGLLDVQAAEDKPGDTGIAADESLPAPAELRARTCSGAQQYQHAVRAQPPESEEQSTR